MKKWFSTLLTILVAALLVFTFSACNTSVITDSFTVSFVDYDGTELKTQTVEHGMSATAPADPTRMGYAFTGWDKAFANVTSDLTITAQYTKNETGWDGSVASGFAGGDGTEATPYLISNGAELAYLAIITNDKNYDVSNKYFKLINDVDLGGREWKPIGVQYYAIGSSYSSSPYCRFCGHFDGDGYVVSNFKITTGESYERYFGLFGILNEGSISNLGVENFTVNMQDWTAYTYAGGIVGYVYDSLITNCYSTGDASASTEATSINYNAYAGGIAGYVYGGKSLIANCYATGDVSASSGGSAYAGGIEGYVYGGKSLITNCYATGDVSASSRSSAYAGGIAGYIYGAITNCYSTGDVSANSNSAAYTGGITGVLDYGAMTNCYATGNMSASSSAASSSSFDAYAGGLIGFKAEDNVTITNCYRYEGQTVTATKGKKEGVICAEGTATSLENLQSESFITGTLDWGKYVSETDRATNENNVWKFEENKFPTLWFAK